MGCSEPCIRGHRSTKCTHANERLMVPVRKPGRPLSSCPHPASRPCSCGRLTAAIPKKQKCGCGTKNGESSTVKTESDDSSKDATPQSPTKGPNANYRIQKATSKSGSSSRSQSIDISGLQRMDPNQLNIMPSLNGFTPNSTPPIPDMSAYSNMGMAPADTPFGPMMFPMFQPQMPPPMMSPGSNNSIPNGGSMLLTGIAATDQNSKPLPKKGSCCGGGNDASIPATQSSTAASSPQNMTENQTKSCCSSGIESPKNEAKVETLPPSDVPTPNSVMMSPFPTPIMMPNGMYGFYPQPTVFTYPPNYGSFMHPLQPEQWRQVMAASMSYGQGPMPAPFVMPGTMPFNPPSTPQPTTGTSHQCTCGDGCQCVGCAAHPYNEATKSYVRSAWESMLDETHAQGHRNGVHTPTTNGASETNAIATTYPTETTTSPTAPRTPSEAASGASEEQTLSANDFFFVSYPFEDACGGEMANCPCGDDCQCLGCVIHNNPIPTSETEQQAS